MKGLVKVTPESLDTIIDKICVIFDRFDETDFLSTKQVWSWLKFRKVTCAYYSCLPHYYQYMSLLKNHLEKLEKMSAQAMEFGDEIWLSELSYCHLLMLSSGDKHANPIYIMDY